MSISRNLLRYVCITAILLLKNAFLMRLFKTKIHSGVGIEQGNRGLISARRGEVLTVHFSIIQFLDYIFYQ